jgi:hypothetical protein
MPSTGAIRVHTSRARPARRWDVPLLLLTLTAAGCASSGAVPRPFPGAPLPPGTAAGETVPPLLGPLLATALQMQGVPYRNGGTDPSGFDCSGFVQYVFARHGVALPREVREQFGAGRAIGRDAVQAGDLVFFQTVSRGASHVGIALGDGTFVHAPSSRGVVRVESYGNSYWSPRWVGARRIDTAMIARR